MDAFGGPVRAHMSAPVHAVGSDARLPEVERMLADTGVSGVPVIDAEGRPIGMITRTDLLDEGAVSAVTGTERARLIVPDRLVTDVSLEPPLGVEESARLADAVRVMRQARVHRVPVVSKGKLVGMLTTWDVVRAIASSWTERPLERFMTAPVVKIAPTLSAGRALEKLRRTHVRALVVAEHGWPIGIFAQEEALAAERWYEPTTVEQWLNPAVLVLPPTLAAHRAAANVIAMDASTIVVSERGRVRGVVTGTNFLYAVPIDGPDGDSARPPPVSWPAGPMSRDTFPAMPAARRERGNG